MGLFGLWRFVDICPRVVDVGDLSLDHSVLGRVLVCILAFDNRTVPTISSRHRLDLQSA